MRYTHVRGDTHVRRGDARRLITCACDLTAEDEFARRRLITRNRQCSGRHDKCVCRRVGRRKLMGFDEVERFPKWTIVLRQLVSTLTLQHDMFKTRVEIGTISCLHSRARSFECVFSIDSNESKRNRKTSNGFFVYHVLAIFFFYSYLLSEVTGRVILKF